MNYQLYILILIITIVFLKFISTFISIYFGSPSGESSGKELIELFKKLNIKKGKTFYDLGSGWGNAIIAARFYGLQVTGFEISPFPYIISVLRTLFNFKIKVKYQDLTKVDYTKADIVYCYLLPGILDKITDKLKKQMKTGGILISKNFSFKNLEESEIIRIKKNKYYIYKF